MEEFPRDSPQKSSRLPLVLVAITTMAIAILLVLVTNSGYAIEPKNYAQQALDEGWEMMPEGEKQFACANMLDGGFEESYYVMVAAPLTGSLQSSDLGQAMRDAEALAQLGEEARVRFLEEIVELVPPEWFRPYTSERCRSVGVRLDW